MFANGRPGSTSSGDDGVSLGSGYIRLHGLRIQRPSWEAELQPLEGVTGVVEVVVFDMSVRHRIGYRWRNSSGSSTDSTPFSHAGSGTPEGDTVSLTPGAGPLFFCCTKELVPLTGCTLGKLIVRRVAHEPDWPRILEAQFIGNSLLSAPLEADVHVPRAGFVYLWLAMCDKNLDSSKVFGHTEWHAHGWGYLPGMLSNCLLVQAGMLLLYLALHLLWRPQFGPAWRSLDRNSLPHFLTFLLLLSLLSSLTTLLELLLLSVTGHRFVVVTLAAVTAGVLQGLLLRAVLVGVAAGFGTLLPKLGPIPGKVLIPAVLYILVVGACEGVRSVGQVDDWGSGEHVALRTPQFCWTSSLLPICSLLLLPHWNRLRRRACRLLAIRCWASFAML
ncbi:hypothetical protein CLOM_g12346 [Closterium sp. NIES-68]|nr:hypothetical protein CLOM_g12346 [Closterium sp. NIES-68]